MNRAESQAKVKRIKSERPDDQTFWCPQCMEWKPARKFANWYGCIECCEPLDEMEIDHEHA